MKETKTIYWKTWLKIELLEGLYKIYRVSSRKFFPQNVFCRLTIVDLIIKFANFNSVWDKDSFLVFLTRKVKLMLWLSVADCGLLPSFGIVLSHWARPRVFLLGLFFFKSQMLIKVGENTAVANRRAKSCFHSAYRQVEKVVKPHQPSSRKCNPPEKKQKKSSAPDGKQEFSFRQNVRALFWTDKRSPKLSTIKLKRQIRLSQNSLLKKIRGFFGFWLPAF